MKRSRYLKRLVQSSLVIMFALNAACSELPASEEASDADVAISSPIIGGSLATTYKEAALISMTRGGATYECSGAVIAPRVVLTAGHCVAGMDSWTVMAPFVAYRKVRGIGEALDYADDGSHTVHPGQHDVGLIYLDEPIALDEYPVLSDQPLPDGSTVVNIGRILDGKLSRSALFVSPPLTVATAAAQGFPLHYMAREVIEPGDSGGPDEVPGTSPHLIVAVNSGAGGAEVLARVDLVKAWIDQRIAEHGGTGSPDVTSVPSAPAAEAGLPNARRPREASPVLPPPG
jgi:hypothetical protein